MICGNVWLNAACAVGSVSNVPDPSEAKKLPTTGELEICGATVTQLMMLAFDVTAREPSVVVPTTVSIPAAEPVYENDAIPLVFVVA